MEPLVWLSKNFFHTSFFQNYASKSSTETEGILEILVSVRRVWALRDLRRFYELLKAVFCKILEIFTSGLGRVYRCRETLCCTKKALALISRFNMRLFLWENIFLLLPFLQEFKLYCVVCESQLWLRDT